MRERHYPFSDAIWAGEIIIVGDPMVGLRDETFQDLMNQEQDILWTRALHCHRQLAVTRNHSFAYICMD